MVLTAISVSIVPSAALTINVKDEITGESVNATIEVLNDTWSYTAYGSSLTLSLSGEYIVRAYNDVYYSRQLLVEGSETATLYLLNRSVPSVLMEYTLQDPSGSTSPQECTLTIRRGDKTINEAHFSSEGKLSVYLDRGSSYHLIVQCGDTVHDLGYHFPQADGKETLTINAITLKPSTELLQSNVKYEIGSSNGEIYLYYNDTLNQTSLVEFWVYNSSGVLMYYANSTSSAVTFYYTIPDQNESYVAAFKAQHAKYGTIEERKPVLSSGLRIDLGIPAEQSWLYPAISCFLLIFVGMLFGYADAKAGAVIIALLAMMLQFFGWLQVPWNILLAAMLIAIIAVLGEGK